jgi:hypothetical protein
MLALGDRVEEWGMGLAPALAAFWLKEDQTGPSVPKLVSRPT